MADRRANTSPMNGAKGRGPVSAEGRRVASRNALSHGILSRELLLPSENPVEFQQLMADLSAELKPEGTLEHGLVERVAVSIWRQRRLVRAENARVWQLQHKQLKNFFLLDEISNGESTDGNWNGIGEQRSVQSVMALLAELAIVSGNAALNDWTLQQFAEHYPLTLSLVFEVLGDPEPQWDGEDVPVLVSDVCLRVDRFSRQQAAIWSARVSAILARDAASVLNDPGQFSRYQSALDNELYKAMRALRQAAKMAAGDT